MSFSTLLALDQLPDMFAGMATSESVVSSTSASHEGVQLAAADTSPATTTATALSQGKPQSHHTLSMTSAAAKNPPPPT